MKRILSYEPGSETIRQLPENYCIAYKKQGRWICEPDLASDYDLGLRVFNALRKFENKYSSGLELLSVITPN
jgi:hypothetical protein